MSVEGQRGTNPRKACRSKKASRSRATLGAALALALTAGATSGCVRKETHEKTLAELDRVRGDKEEAERSLAKAREEIERLGHAMAERDSTELEGVGQRASLASELESSERNNEELGERLRSASRALETLRDRNGTLSQELTGLKEQIGALERAQREAEARVARQRALLDHFRGMVDAGDLEVELSDGRVLLVLGSDVLFAPAKASLSEGGLAVVRRVGERLAKLPDLELQVGGHTDDAPIHTDRFPSNWDLSTARATTVVRELEQSGVAPERLSAAGFGEYRPIADNATDDGRADNRRIEIALVLNAEHLWKATGKEARSETSEPASKPTSQRRDQSDDDDTSDDEASDDESDDSES